MDMVWVRFFFPYRLQLGHRVWGMDEAPSPVGIAATLQEVGMFIGVAGVWVRPRVAEP